MYKLIALLESLYRVHIVELNLYISKSSVSLRGFDGYKLKSLLEPL